MCVFEGTLFAVALKGHNQRRPCFGMLRFVPVKRTWDNLEPAAHSARKMHELLHHVRWLKPYG